MKIAFYKGTKSGINGIYNRGVRWIEDGLYSHCEIIFSNGLSASSSFMDGGVRFKDIEYDLAKWDVIDLPWADEKKAITYFTQRLGKPYNLRGNLHFIFGFIRGDSDGEFCSEACAGALGIVNPWQFAPNQLFNVVNFMNERFKMSDENTVPVVPPNPIVPPAEPTPEPFTGHGKPPEKP